MNQLQKQDQARPYTMGWNAFWSSIQNCGDWCKVSSISWIVHKLIYRISSYSFLPWIVSSPWIAFLILRGNYSRFHYIRAMKTWIVSSLDEFKKRIVAAAIIWGNTVYEDIWHSYLLNGAARTKGTELYIYYSILHTVFPQIVSAETILFWTFKTLEISYSFRIMFSLM